MRGHDHDLDAPQSLRPAPARIGEHHSDPAHAVPALIGERTDVLDVDSVAALQRTAGNAAVAQRLGHEDGDERSPVHDVIGRGGGRALDPDTRADMEARLGHDFSDVRVHDDARAHESAVAVNAHAYTVGSDVVFQRDRYDPTSHAGRLTLAHELTHVVQQRNGPVDGTPAPGGVRISDPGDRFEREAAANAERVLQRQDAAETAAAPEEAEEEPPVQTLPAGVPAVQRAEGDEEDVPE